jgi:hypothetical protein
VAFTKNNVPGGVASRAGLITSVLSQESGFWGRGLWTGAGLIVSAFPSGSPRIGRGLQQQGKLLGAWLFASCAPRGRGQRGGVASGGGRARTSEAVGIEARGGRGEAGPVGEAVDGAHARGWAPAAPARRLNRVAYAAIGQPARVTLVQALVPGQVQLSHRGQRCALAVALGTRTGQSQAAGRAHVEDLACGRGVGRGQGTPQNGSVRVVVRGGCDLCSPEH